MADNAMERRFLGRVPFQRAAGHFFYSRDSDMARLIHDFKYHGFPDLARELGRLVGRELMSTSFLDDAEIIVPVPMHWRKLIIRGYNQSLEIARGLSDATTLPVVEAIKAVRHHRTQTSMSLSGRLNNISGMFRLNERVNVSGRGVLLVDDVCTTGATLSEAGELLAAGAPGCRLTLLTMAVTF